MRVGSRRDPALTLVFILITCHFYYYFFIYRVSRETQEFLGIQEISPGVEVLLSLLTCGLWVIYWDYRIGRRIQEMSIRAGLPEIDNTGLYIVLDLLGFGGIASAGIVNPVIQQDALNRIWDAARGIRNPTEPPNQWPPYPGYGTPTPRQPRDPKT